MVDQLVPVSPVLQVADRLDPSRRIRGRKVVGDGPVTHLAQPDFETHISGLKAVDKGRKCFDTNQGCIYFAEYYAVGGGSGSGVGNGVWGKKGGKEKGENCIKSGVKSIIVKDIDIGMINDPTTYSK